MVQKYFGLSSYAVFADDFTIQNIFWTEIKLAHLTQIGKGAGGPKKEVGARSIAGSRVIGEKEWFRCVL